MTLNLNERFSLAGILPVESNYDDLKMLRELREELAVTEKEKKEIGWRDFPDGSAQWEGSKVVPLTIVFNESKLTIIKNALKKLNSGDKMTIAHMSLYEKFVLEQDVELSPNSEDMKDLPDSSKDKEPDTSIDDLPAPEDVEPVPIKLPVQGESDKGLSQPEID